MKGRVPYEVPVCEFGVLGTVVFDVDQTAGCFSAEGCGQFFDDFADKEAALEAIGVIGRKGDLSFVVDFAWVRRGVPLLETILASTSQV